MANTTVTNAQTAIKPKKIEPAFDSVFIYFRSPVTIKHPPSEMLQFTSFETPGDLWVGWARWFKDLKENVVFQDK